MTPRNAGRGRNRRDAMLEAVVATLLCLILVAAFGSPASGATRTIQPSSVDAHIVEDSANGNNGLRAQRPASGRPDQISRVFSEPDTAEFPAGEHFR